MRFSVKSFAELEKAYAHMPAHVADQRWQAAGSLTVDRENSLLRLSSDKPIPLSRQPNGWLDFEIKLADGQTALLHNAIETYWTTHRLGAPDASHNIHIFPNFIIFNVKGLTEDHKIRIISFKLKGLSAFFNYQTVEYLAAYDLSSEQRTLLQSLRLSWNETEFFEPQDIFVAHKLQQAISFKANGRKYSVSFSARMNGPTRQRIDIQTWPIARIEFDGSVSIDEALKQVWAWRQFFEQVALHTMAIDAVSAKGDPRAIAHAADFYMPNAPLTDEQNQDAVLSHEIPLSEWPDRLRLSGIMQKWLSLQESRATFRGLLGSVINAMQRTVHLDHVIRLCAAVESLEELTGESPIQKSDIAAMSNAAGAVAANRKLPLDPQRITDCLSSLRRLSLKRRLDILIDAISDHIDADDGQLVARHACKLRQAGAHAQSVSELREPLIGPVAAGLAAMCALFDLTSCGYPSERSDDGPAIRARSTVSEVATHLRYFKFDNSAF